MPPEHEDVLRVRREGPSALLDVVPGASERASLHFAFVVPAFGRGSGGHAAIFTLAAGLERLGHTCSTWVHDPGAKLGRAGSALLRQRALEWFSPMRGPVTRGFEGWHGADVVVATGWETVYPALMLPGCHARAYLVHDHEPEFFATSAERQWAEDTYRFGLYPVCGGRWLRDLLAERYGARGSWYRFGVDSDVYRPLAEERDRDTVVFYARAALSRSVFSRSRSSCAAGREPRSSRSARTSRPGRRSSTRRWASRRRARWPRPTPAQLPASASRSPTTP